MTNLLACAYSSDMQRAPITTNNERREMRDFIFRHLYLVGTREQDVLVMRYGVIGTYQPGWDEIAEAANVHYDDVQSVHDYALKEIARHTVDDKLPLILLEPKANISQLKERARIAATRAIQSGQLVPQPCEGCGEPAEKSQAHHANYQQPLKVQWLCRKCHGLAHSKKARIAEALGRTWPKQPAA